jgi:RNA polymerase sigma factor (sigma-70 family)
LIVANLDEELARHHRAAFGWALACCRWDPSAAEDVLQTAYLKIVDGRADFAGRSEFRTFLFGVLPLAALARENVAHIVPVGTASIVREETSRQLVTALTQLPARQREVLHLVFYNELTIAEAAKVLGISLGTARVHYERGKARLREILGSQ